MAIDRWKTYRISDLVAEGVLTIGDGYRAKNNELDSIGLPFARAGNINCGFLFIDADLLGFDGVNKAGDKISRAGDVVFTSKGTVGRFAYVQENTLRFVYSPQLCYWRSHIPDIIDPRFLYFWMHGQEFYSQFSGVKSQTDMADYVNLRDQRAMRITLPFIGEQHAIARILGSFDDKIELNRQTNATLEAMARALFKSWFVDFDPVRAKMEGRQPDGMDAATAAMFPDCFEDSSLGKIPKGWRVRPLDDIAIFLNGLAMQKYPPIGDVYLPVIKITELRRGITDSSNQASLHIPEQYIINNGDVLFSWSGSLDVVVWCGGRGGLNQHLFKITSQEYPKWFYLYWTRHYLPDFQTIAKAKATTMGHIQRHHLTMALTLVPTEQILNAMDNTMSPILERVIANTIESCTLRAIRDSLLPKLLSGEVTV